jgi:tetratricopeptide (TPR) repeat protein
VPTLDNLTSSHLRQSQFGEALELSGRAYAIARKAYGDRHLFTAQRMMNRAIVLAHVGRYSEAGELLKPALEIQLGALGENNAEAASTMAKLAAVRFHQRLPDEAVSLYRRAIEVFERVRGVNEEEVAGVLGNYGWVLRQTGQKEEGKKLEARARAILAMHQDDRTRFSVDVSELFSPRRQPLVQGEMESRRLR